MWHLPQGVPCVVGLSRLRVGLDNESDLQLDVMSVIPISPIRMDELQKATLSDPVMQTLTHFINNGWTEKYKSVLPEVRSYVSVRDELITSKCCCLLSVVFNELEEVVEHVQKSS